MIYIALYDFFSFIKANYTYHLLFDLTIFDEKKTLLARIKATKEKHKTPDIPKLYFNKLLSLLIKSMRNKELEYKYRAISCIYIILSQTGLRIGEILSLEVDALDSIKLKNLDTIAYFLKYNTFKPAGKDEEYIPGDIFANELTKEAFEILVELRKGQKNSEGNNFIYLPDTKILPATNKTSNCHFYSFLAELADFAQGNVSPYKELTVVKNNDKPVFAPTTKQFRVRVCTELYERNVPLLYIKKYMSHLSDEMIGYYSRPKTQKQEDAEYSNKLLKDLVQNEVSLLGNDSKQINANIDSFIKENNLTVEDDIDSIIKSLNGRFVIRAKRGGVCVKTSIRECARDARTNEMFCAYDICPNLFRLYYMADVSYEDFKLTQKTFQSNKENGFKLQASKELNKLHDLCRRRLIPELEDLKKRVQTKGMQEILTNYPNLSDIILNYDGIMEEVNLWMKVKY